MAPQVDAPLNAVPLKHITAHFQLEGSPAHVKDALFSNSSTFTTELLVWSQGSDISIGEWQGGSAVQRTVTFTQAIDAPVSPVKAAPCVWTQRLEHVHDGTLVLETKSQLSNVPFSSQWAVFFRWTFAPAKDNDACLVTLSMQVVFYKPLVWKAKVESEALKAARKGAPGIEELLRTFLANKARQDLASILANLAFQAEANADEDRMSGVRASRRSSVEAAVIQVSVEEAAARA